MARYSSISSLLLRGRRCDLPAGARRGWDRGDQHYPPVLGRSDRSGPRPDGQPVVDPGPCRGGRRGRDWPPHERPGLAGADGLRPERGSVRQGRPVVGAHGCRLFTDPGAEVTLVTYSVATDSWGNWSSSCGEWLNSIGYRLSAARRP